MADKKLRIEIKRVTRETDKAYAIELLDGRKDWMPKSSTSIEKVGSKTYLLCQEWSYKAKFDVGGTNPPIDPTNPKAVDKSKSMGEDLFPKTKDIIPPRKLQQPTLEEFLGSKTEDLSKKVSKSTPEQKIYKNQIIEVLKRCIKDLEDLD